jgi:NADPH:quinone reductase-like Zn-dependent oxidoreductase
MSTHSAIATVGIKAPLGIIQVPTITPTDNQVRVKVEWTASTPLDLHQNDSGLLVTHPQVLGDSTAGIVVEIGSGVKRLKVGDKVFGFTWRTQSEKAQQEFCTTDEWLFAVVGSLNTLMIQLGYPTECVLTKFSCPKGSQCRRQSPSPTTSSPSSMH